MQHTAVRNQIKQIQDAWIKLLFDFRAWFFPKTPQGEHWKFRPAHHALRACQSRLMDDAESMLAEYRKNDNQQPIVENKDTQQGSSSYLPIMLTANAMLDSLPMASQINATPYFTDVAIQGQLARIRLEPIAIRFQIAFYATNPYGVRDVLNQFCTYFSDDTKRMIYVPFFVGEKDGKPIMESFRFTAFENELFPAVMNGEQKNLAVGTVDVTLCGCIPHVVGLDLHGSDKIDGGIDGKGNPLNTPDLIDKVVIQADLHDREHWVIKTDRETVETTIEKNHD